MAARHERALGALPGRAAQQSTFSNRSAWGRSLRAVYGVFTVVLRWFYGFSLFKYVLFVVFFGVSLSFVMVSHALKGELMKLASG